MLTTRRKFIGLGIGVLASATAITTAYKWYVGDPQSVIIAILSRRLKLLGAENNSFKLFAIDYLEYRKDYRAKLSKMAIVSWPLRFISPYGLLPMGTALRRLEDNVVSMYLLSTDFFQNGAASNMPVQYLSFYDPYVSICRNPFLNQK